MRYVSEKVLGYFCASEFESKDELLDYIKAECKELPDRQWQTLEEFKANPVDGWCWIDTESMSMRMAFYSDGVFNTTDEMSGYYVTDAITHVMPIPKPEAPK